MGIGTCFIRNQNFLKTLRIAQQCKTENFSEIIRRHNIIHQECCFNEVTIALISAVSIFITPALKHKSIEEFSEVINVKNITLRVCGILFPNLAGGLQGNKRRKC